jgi:hypothetical protein
MQSSGRISKILFVSEAHRGPYPYDFAGVPDAIKRLGLEVKLLDPGSASFETYRESVGNFKPDVVFCFLRHAWAVAQMSDFLKQYHPVVTLNWFQEDPNYVSHQMLESSRQFDYWFTIDARMIPFWPTRAQFMPPAFDEQIYKNLALERIYGVSFIGQWGHALSTEMYLPYMEELARLGKQAMLCLERPVGIPFLPQPLERVLRHRRIRPLLQRFPWWRHRWSNPQNGQEKSIIINQSKIHFGISRVRGYWEPDLKTLIPKYPMDKHGLYYQLKTRVFHATGAGAMLLNDYCPELEPLFDIGKEIVTFEFNDMADVREKLAWYIVHDSERERLAQAGYERAHKQHTFTARIQQIFDVVRKDI